jgi:hypothetical protein
MKTLSRTFRFVVLGVIVTVGVVSCCTFPFITNTAPFFGVEIGNTQRDQYVKWKQPAFDNALIQLCEEHGGTYCLKAKLDNGSVTRRYYPKSHKDCTDKDCSFGNIRTVKVTKSKVADNTAAGQSAANDPNIMHRVQSPDPGDIKKVLDALEQ